MDLKHRRKIKDEDSRSQIQNLFNTEDPNCCKKGKCYIHFIFLTSRKQSFKYFYLKPKSFSFLHFFFNFILYKYTLLFISKNLNNIIFTRCWSNGRNCNPVVYISYMLVF